MLLAGHSIFKHVLFAKVLSEITAKYFKALDMEHIFLTLHHYTFFERGNEPSVSIIGLTHTIGQQANNFHLCIPRPIPFV